MTQWLQTHEPVHAFSFDGFDIGTPQSSLDAIAHQLDGDASIAPSARLEDSHLGANVHVMGDAEIRNATLERAVVVPGSTVADAAVRNSVLDEESMVEGVSLDGAVVALHSTVRC